MTIFVDHKALKHALKKLKDVRIVDLLDYDVISWFDAEKKWINLAPELLPIYLNQCLDTAILNPADGEVLTYVGADQLWHNRPSVAGMQFKGYTEATTDITIPAGQSAYLGIDLTIPVTSGKTYLILVWASFGRDSGDWGEVELACMTGAVYLAGACVDLPRIRSHLGAGGNEGRYATLLFCRYVATSTGNRTFRPFATNFSLVSVISEGALRWRRKITIFEA